jgi:hypothetical protein
VNTETRYTFTLEAHLSVEEGFSFLMTPAETMDSAMKLKDAPPIKVREPEDLIRVVRFRKEE